jgi:hypothetical protein
LGIIENVPREQLVEPRTARQKTRSFPKKRAWSRTVVRSRPFRLFRLLRWLRSRARVLLRCKPPR